MIQEDIKACVAKLKHEGTISAINVELMDNELAAVYAATKKAEVSRNNNKPTSYSVPIYCC